jgi:hypothetical protein
MEFRPGGGEQANICLNSKEYGRMGAREGITIYNKQVEQAEFIINLGDGRASVTRFTLLLGLSRWPGMGRWRMGLTSRRPSLLMKHSLKEGVGRSWASINTSNIYGVKQNEKRRLFKAVVA